MKKEVVELSEAFDFFGGRIVVGSEVEQQMEKLIEKMLK